MSCIVGCCIELVQGGMSGMTAKESYSYVLVLILISRPVFVWGVIDCPMAVWACLVTVTLSHFSCTRVWSEATSVAKP